MKVKSLIALLFMASFAAFISGCQATDQLQDAPYSIVYSVQESENRSIYLSDEAGQSRIKIIDITVADGYPAASPDGERIAFYGKYDNYNTWSIHVGNIDGSDIQRLTHEQSVWDSSPSWSPDGSTIAFAREYKDLKGKWQEEIWLMKADGSNKRQIEAIEGRSPEFMPDGRILFQSKADPSQICIANIDGSNLTILTNDDTNNLSPKLSPDGTKIAYLSNRDGNQELYIMDIDGSNDKRLTFNSIQDWGPSWSTDGTSIFFPSQSTHGFYDIYKVNIDGSSLEKLIDQGSQVSRLPQLNKQTLESLTKLKTKKVDQQGL